MRCATPTEACLRAERPCRAAAVVVTWQRADLLAAALHSLLGQQQAFARIIVVDNGDLDATRDAVACVPDCVYLPMLANRGFAAGCNAGIVHALSDPDIDAVALLNDDVQLERQWLAEACAALHNDEDVGSCATLMLCDADAALVDSAGITWRSATRADNLWHGRPAVSVPPDIAEVYGACAGAALFRRALFEDVGLMDASLFAYQEDVDLALRARHRGWRCVLAPAARCRHRGSASNRRFPAGGTYADYYNARNRLQVMAQSLPASDWRRHGWRLPLEAIGDVVRSLPERRFGAVLLGSLHGLARMPTALLRRWFASSHGAPTNELRKPA